MAMIPTETKRGRPAVYANAAERQAAYRARKGTVNLSIQLDPETAEALREYMTRHQMDGAGLTQSQVIERLIKQQLLRKR